MKPPEDYPGGVPLSIKYPEIALYEFWRNSARKFPRRPAVWYLGREHTYGELWDQSLRLAHSMKQRGIGKGSRVALLLPNTPHFPVAYNATLLLGATAVLLNPLQKPEELGQQLKETGAEMLITLDRLLGALPSNHPPLVLGKATQYAAPHLRALDALTNHREKKGESFNSLLRGERLREPAIINPREDEAVVLYTSGTTGRPKGVVLTHYALVANALQSYYWLRGWGYSPKPQPRGYPVVVCSVPFFHSYGLVVFNEAVSFGCLMALLPKPDAEKIMETTQRLRATHLPTIPLFIKEMLNHPKLREYDLTSLTHCSTGGSSIRAEYIQRLEEVVKTRVYQGYGLTEMGPTISATPVEGPPKYGSVGLPYPDTQVKIVDIKTREFELPPGEVGEIVVKGPQMMKGYLGDPQATLDTIRGGWLYTGDVGFLDEEGYLYVLGRKRDRIVAGGHAVWPTKVEAVLEKHPKVERAVAIGAPDPLRCATDLQAVVVPRETPPGDALEKELIQHCKENLEEFEVPSRIIFKDALPLNQRGEVDRMKVSQAVEEEVWSRLQRQP